MTTEIVFYKVTGSEPFGFAHQPYDYDIDGRGTVLAKDKDKLAADFAKSLQYSDLDDIQVDGDSFSWKEDTGEDELETRTAEVVRVVVTPADEAVYFFNYSTSERERSGWVDADEWIATYFDPNGPVEYIRDFIDAFDAVLMQPVAVAVKKNRMAHTREELIAKYAELEHDTTQNFPPPVLFVDVDALEAELEGYREGDHEEESA